MISHTNIFLCKLQKYLFTLNRSIFLLSHAVTQNILVFWTVTVVGIKVFLFLSKCLSLSIPKYMLGKREKSETLQQEKMQLFFTLFPIQCVLKPLPKPESSYYFLLTESQKRATGCQPVSKVASCQLSCQHQSCSAVTEWMCMICTNVFDILLFVQLTVGPNFHLICIRYLCPKYQHQEILSLFIIVSGNWLWIRCANFALYWRYIFFSIIILGIEIEYKDLIFWSCLVHCSARISKENHSS